MLLNGSPRNTLRLLNILTENIIGTGTWKLELSKLSLSNAVGALVTRSTVLYKIDLRSVPIVPVPVPLGAYAAVHTRWPHAQHAP